MPILNDLNQIDYTAPAPLLNTNLVVDITSQTTNLATAAGSLRDSIKTALTPLTQQLAASQIAPSPGDNLVLTTTSDGVLSWAAVSGSVDTFTSINFEKEFLSTNYMGTDDIPKNILQGALNHDPTFMTGFGNTIFVLDTTDKFIYAYDRVSKIELTGQKFTGLDAAGNDSPRGIWTDGTTMWCADADRTVYAYNVNTKIRDTSKEFTLDSNNSSPQGIWGSTINNIQTLFVIDSSDYDIYVYNMSNGNRIESMEFLNLHNSGNDQPKGLWSDGVYLWIVDSSDDKLYCYDLYKKTRVPQYDFEHLRANAGGPHGTGNSDGNSSPYDCWSDGKVMYVIDTSDDAVYGYALWNINKTDSSNQYTLETAMTKNIASATESTNREITFSIPQQADLNYKVLTNAAVVDRQLTTVKVQYPRNADSVNIGIIT